MTMNRPRCHVHCCPRHYALSVEENQFGFIFKNRTVQNLSYVRMVFQRKLCAIHNSN